MLDERLLELWNLSSESDKLRAELCCLDSFNCIIWHVHKSTLNDFNKVAEDVNCRKQEGK